MPQAFYYYEGVCDAYIESTGNLRGPRGGLGRRGHAGCFRRNPEADTSGPFGVLQIESAQIRSVRHRGRGGRGARQGYAAHRKPILDERTAARKQPRLHARTQLRENTAVGRQNRLDRRKLSAHI